MALSNEERFYCGRSFGGVTVRAGRFGQFSFCKVLRTAGFNASTLAAAVGDNRSRERQSPAGATVRGFGRGAPLWRSAHFRQQDYRQRFSASRSLNLLPDKSFLSAHCSALAISTSVGLNVKLSALYNAPGHPCKVAIRRATCGLEGKGLMSPSVPNTVIYAVLSPRQQEIATLAARGLSNKDIARQLGIAEGTVKFQVHNILQRLGMKRRAELIMHGVPR